MKCEDIVLEIFIDSNHPERAERLETKGLRYIAFNVDNLDEIVKNIKCEEIRSDWYGRRFTFTKDMDGQTIELKEAKIKE